MKKTSLENASPAGNSEVNGTLRAADHHHHEAKAAARKHASNVRLRHPFVESEAYRQVLARLPKGPAANKPESGHWPPGRWAKVLLLLLSLLATLWLGWEARSLATTTFAAHLQAIWWELNAN